MNRDFFADLIIGGVIFTAIGLPVFHRERDGSRIRLPDRLRDVRANHYGALVSFVAWYIGRGMLIVGLVGYVLASCSAPPT